MSKAWMTETENLIEAIEQEKRSLSEEHAKLTKALVIKDEELTHWKAVLHSYGQRHQSESPQPSLFLQKADNHNSLSHRDIALLVRDQNDGYIPMLQLTEVLRRKVETPAHAASAA